MRSHIILMTAFRPLLPLPLTLLAPWSVVKKIKKFGRAVEKRKKYGETDLTPVRLLKSVS